MALQLNNPQLFKEAAHILEGLQQLTEAAEMYDKSGQCGSTEDGSSSRPP